MSALKEEVSNQGRVVVAKAYADWVTRSPELKGASQFINDPPALYAAGIEPVYVPTRLPLSGTSSDSHRTSRVKNSVDVKMTADCIECAHSHPNIHTYVLVSGDSDFIHVINALRSMGKRAVIIGVSWSTSRRLADQVDGLILYDTDVDPEATVEPAAPASNGRQSARSSSANRQQLSDVIRVIEDIVRTERQAGRTPLLTSLKQRLMRRLPGFDEKKLGFSGFKKLMLRACEDGNIKLATVGLVDWVIMADEATPQEANGESSETDLGAGDEISVGEEVVTRDELPKEAETPVAEDEAESEAELAPVNGLAPEVNLAEARVEVASSPELPSPNLEQALAEALEGLKLPQDPGDGLTGRRVVDLIVAADTLESRDGEDQVAFNSLVNEVCQALSQGLEAEDEGISQRWSQVYSRSYVTRMVRGLKDGEVFQQAWRTVLDQETGKKRRRSTFNLNRQNALVQGSLSTQWQVPAAAPPEFSAAADEADPEDSEPEGVNWPEVSEETGPVLPFDDIGMPEAGSDAASRFGSKVMRFFSRS